jgi:hypothetical protein
MSRCNNEVFKAIIGQCTVAPCTIEAFVYVFERSSALQYRVVSHKTLERSPVRRSTTIWSGTGRFGRGLTKIVFGRCASLPYL